VRDPYASGGKSAVALRRTQLAMKVCASSRSFARQFDAGRLTQLEWIDVVCEQALDGVDLSTEHFPRRDDDYLAQVKKLCVDRGLTIAGVNTNVDFGAGVIDPQIDTLRAATDVAAAIGAPIARFDCGAAQGSPGVAWRELVRGLKSICDHAKRRNVTMALAPKSGTLVATEADVKRALKECDSAWLRLAVPATPDWELFARDAVIMVAPPQGFDMAAALRFRGFISLENDAGGDDVEHLRRWVGSLFVS